MNHPSVRLQLEQISHQLAIVSTGLIAAGWVLISITGKAKGNWKLISSEASLGFFLAARPLRRQAIALTRQSQNAEEIMLTAFQQ